MLRNVGLFLLSVVLAVTSVTSSALGQQWAEKMFNKTNHDFGSVARGAKAEFAFVLSNHYTEDVHIASVRTSCGCTDPRIEKE